MKTKRNILNLVIFSLFAMISLTAVFSENTGRYKIDFYAGWGMGSDQYALGNALLNWSKIYLNLSNDNTEIFNYSTTMFLKQDPYTGAGSTGSHSSSFEDSMSSHLLEINLAPFPGGLNTHIKEIEINLSSQNDMLSPSINYLRIQAKPRLSQTLSQAPAEARCIEVINQKVSCNLASIGSVGSCNSDSSFVKASARLLQAEFEERNKADNTKSFNQSEYGSGICLLSLNGALLPNEDPCEFGVQCESGCCAYSIANPTTGVCKSSNHKVDANGNYLSIDPAFSCGKPIGASCNDYGTINDSLICTSHCCASSALVCCPMNPSGTFNCSSHSGESCRQNLEI